MKILLVSPAVDPETRTNRELMMPQLALYILDGLTPTEQAEESDTGEADITKLDGDNDGTPQFQYAKDGKKGIASVYASKVRIETPKKGMGKTKTIGLLEDNE